METFMFDVFRRIFVAYNKTVTGVFRKDEEEEKIKKIREKNKMHAKCIKRGSNGWFSR